MANQIDSISFNGQALNFGQLTPKHQKLVVQCLMNQLLKDHQIKSFLKESGKKIDVLFASTVRGDTTLKIDGIGSVTLRLKGKAVMKDIHRISKVFRYYQN